jgi:hypothetical protein
MKTAQSFRYLAKVAIIVAALLSFNPRAALAACGAYPVGSVTDGQVSFLSSAPNLPFIGPTSVQAPEAGALVYNSADNTLQLCDGTAWKILNTGPAGTVVGQVQFNNASVFGADAEFVYNPTNNQLAVGTATVNASAALDVSSTTRGFLPPRMTTAQRNSIGATTEGLIIFNTDTKEMQYFNGTLWRPFGAVALGGDGMTSGAASVSCKQLLTDYNPGNGLYWIDPDGTSGPVSPFQGYCDMTTDGGGWLLVMRNANVATNISNGFWNKTWVNYKAGFGDVSVPSSSGWIGNDKLNWLTVGGREFVVRDSTMNHYYANFSVMNETNKYKMTVQSTATSNDASYPFSTYHSGANFTTADQDNDGQAGNCATNYGNTGWWYQPSGCYWMIYSANNTSGTYWRTNGSYYTPTWSEFWIR